jgi:hypothetical protein
MHRGVFHRSRLKRLVLLLVVAAALLSAMPSTADAHLYRSTGVWTFRYFTRPAYATGDKTPCLSEDSHYWIDPLNIIFFAYGEGTRIGSHIDADTPWGFTTIYGEQAICGDTDQYPGNYDVAKAEWNDLSEPSCLTCTRYHVRLWLAPHGHSDVYSKWSTVDAHHETWTGSNHVIDMDWESAEYHLGSQMSGHHYFAYDYWTRRAGQYIQGRWDDGMTTRVGGEHDNVYP